MSDHATKLTPTPGQTVGPFYGYALPYDKDRELLAPGSPGSIRLQGTVYDGAGHPIPDAILEIWQAGRRGQHRRTAPAPWSATATPSPASAAAPWATPACSPSPP